jgi:ParB family chromosome partitioning protein
MTKKAEEISRIPSTSHKVDTDAIALKVKQEFIAKEKMHPAKRTVAKSQLKAVKRSKDA